MKKIMAVLSALIMAVSFLVVTTVTAPPASAACTSEVNSKWDYAHLLDNEDEGATYVRFWSQVYFYDCGSYNTFRYIKIGYQPDTTKNSSIKCGNYTGIDRIRMNLGQIAGQNPATWDTDCVSSGQTKTYDFANFNMWDWETGDNRCAGVHWTAVLRVWNDQAGDIPAVCF